MRIHGLPTIARCASGLIISVALSACARSAAETPPPAAATPSRLAPSAPPAPPAPPPATTTPPAPAPTQPAADTAAESLPMLHVWLRADLPVEPFVLERTTVFVRSLDTEPFPSVVLPAHALREDRIAPEDRLFAGIATGEMPSPTGAPLSIITGQVFSLSGDWPRAGALVLGGGLMQTRYEWRGGAWKQALSCDMPDWYQVGDLAPFLALWNRDCLYEKRDRPPSGAVRLLTGNQGKRPARAQRTPAPASCNSKGPRVVGGMRMIGGVSGSGTLVSVGQDCVTHAPALEVWPRGSSASQVLPAPCGLGETPPALIDLSDGSLLLYQPSTCLLRYDGTSVEQASPPGESLTDLHVSPNGRMVAVGKRVWTRSVGDPSWAEVDTSVCGKKAPDQAAFDDSGELWVTCDALWRRHEGAWRGYRAPDDVAITDLRRAHDGRVVIIGNGGRVVLGPTEPADVARAMVMQ